MNLRRLSLGALAALALAAAGCGGDDDGDSGNGGSGASDVTLDVWTNEFQPDRVKATEQSLAKFTQETGIKTKLVAIPEDQLSTLVTNATAAGDLPDVIAGVNVADSQRYAKEELLDTEATEEVVDALGADTFSAAGAGARQRRRRSDRRARPTAGASCWSTARTCSRRPAWSPPRPTTTSRRPPRSSTATAWPGSRWPPRRATPSPQQTFEYVALANGCQLVDDGGNVTLDSPECVEAFDLYGDLAAQFSSRARRTSTPPAATYFAGQAAMMFWSSFLLDELAGPAQRRQPSCAECTADPALLAENSGVVTAVAGPAGRPAASSARSSSVDRGRRGRRPESQGASSST